MKIHIVLEEQTLDLLNKKEELLKNLKHYPNFVETSIDDADFLIIIPNYPMDGSNKFNDNLTKFLINDTENFEESEIFLLDCDNTLMVLDDNKSIYNDFYFSNNRSFVDIFGDFSVVKEPIKEVIKEPIKEVIEPIKEVIKEAIEPIKEVVKEVAKSKKRLLLGAC
jgi:hypothetical protein